MGAVAATQRLRVEAAVIPPPAAVVVEAILHLRVVAVAIPHRVAVAEAVAEATVPAAAPTEVDTVKLT